MAVAGIEGRRGRMLRLALAGASGRMGRAVVTRLADEPKMTLRHAWVGGASSSLHQPVITTSGVRLMKERAGTANPSVTPSETQSKTNAQTTKRSAEDALCYTSLLEARAALAEDPVDALIDFSLPEASRDVLELCMQAKLPLVYCATGGTAASQDLIAQCVQVVPVVVAANTSVGVCVLQALAGLAARWLGDSYDAEIVEMHHRRKVDAPSGTALHLGEAVARGKNLPWPESGRFSREGQCGARGNDEIGVMALRGGDVVGEHTVLFASDTERVELTHRAADRGLFAEGALRAARWVHEQPPGCYAMQDVLGLRATLPS